MRDGSVESFTPATQRRGPGEYQLSRGSAFVAMNKQEQIKFIEEKFKEIDTTELAGIVRAIFGHPHDKGRPAKT